MPRRLLAVTALLAMFGACRDGPAELTLPVEARIAPQPDVTVLNYERTSTFAVLQIDAGAIGGFTTFACSPD